MAKQKQIGLLTLCERVRKPDMHKVAELTLIARGTRTSAAFADDSRLFPSTISRLLKGDFKRSISEDVIAAMAVNSDDRSPEWFKEYLDAYGMIVPSSKELSNDEILIMYSELFGIVKQGYSFSRRHMYK